MINRFLYGAAYYEEYLPYDRLKEDFEMMKKAGFTVIRIAESTWSTEEPKEGEYDFSHVDRVIDIAQEYDIDVIIGTPTYAVPYWLVQKDENVLATTERGHNKYGTRQNMDITNKTYLAAAEKIIRALVSHTAKRDNVIGFQIDNETKHYGTSSPLVQQGFREYLKKKFGTIEALNKAYGFAYWSNSVTSFDDLPDANFTINGSYGCAFQEYQRSLAASFLKWQSDIVNEYKRDDQFITQNFDYDWKSFGVPGSQEGFSHGLQNGISHFDGANAVTIAGTDVYHNTQDELTGLEIAFAGDEMRCLKSDKQEYIVLETQAQAFREWLPYPGQLRLCAMSNMASGATGVMYWNYFSIHNSKETYWKGLLSHDFLPNPTYDEACTASKELQKVFAKTGAISHNNKVAIMVSNNSMAALSWFNTDKDYGYNDILLSYYKALYECNIECDIIFPQSEDWENKYDVIITPAFYSVDDDTIDRFRAFVSKGNTLISTFRSFVTDENIKVSHTPLPRNMTDVFGMTYNQYTKPVSTYVNNSKPSFWMELLKPDTAERIHKYQHKYWGEYSAVTKNKFSSGTAWYIGCDLPQEALEEILCDAVLQATGEEYHHSFPLIIKNGISQKGKNIKFILNFSSDNITYKSDRNYKILNASENAKVLKGETINLCDWDVIVLEED